MNMSGWQLFWTMVACFAIIYFIRDSNSNYSKDDALTRSFKMPLAALLESGKERATLAELYGGTIFEGDKICMYYPYPGIKASVTSREVLKRDFPEEAKRIENLKIRYDYPEWMTAVQGKNGVVALMGKRRMQGYNAFIRMESIQTKADGEAFRYTHSESGSRCFDFANSIFRIEKVSNSNFAITLTDKDSPADKSFTPPAGTSPP